MKSLGKLLFLLVIVALIVFGVWKALDSTLFSEEEHVVTASSTASITNLPPPATEPKPLSEDEAFASTSDTTETEDLRLSCSEANEIFSQLYDMRKENKAYDQALSFLQEDGSIPEEHINLFIGLANSLWSSPIDQIKPKGEVTAQFSEQCFKIEQAQ